MWAAAQTTTSDLESIRFCLSRGACPHLAAKYKNGLCDSFDFAGICKDLGHSQKIRTLLEHASMCSCGGPRAAEAKVPTPSACARDYTSPHAHCNLAEHRHVYNIESEEASKRYLNVDKGASRNGALVRLWNDPDRPNTQWRLLRLWGDTNKYQKRISRWSTVRRIYPALGKRPLESLL